MTSRLQIIKENFTRAVAVHQHRAIQEGLAELCDGVTFTCDFSRKESIDSVVDDLSPVKTDFVMTDSKSVTIPLSPLATSPVMKISPTSVARDIDCSDPNSMPPTPSIFLRINNFEKLKIVCQVQFKYSHRYCMVTVPSKLIRTLKLGDFVITEGEKNQEDLGVITNAYSVEDFHLMRSYVGQSQDAEENMVGNILRLATSADRVKLPKKAAREESILGLCRDLARDRYKLSMNIYGVEYQFDGAKLSIYYTSDARVDYREFAQDLFSRFRTKIWMRKTNQCTVFIPKPFATYALETGSNAFNYYN